MSRLVVIDEAELAALIRREVRAALDQRVPAAPEPAEWLDTAGAAELLGVSGRTIRNMVARGELPEHRAGRLLRFRRCEVEALLRRQG